MSMTFTENITLEKMECGSCGGIFALTSHFIETKKRESGGFTCPYCAQKRGWWESKADKLEKELEAKRRELSAERCNVLKERNQREEAERVLAKHKTRTKNGVCPCCQRSFINLKRHIASKHPEFK